MPIADSAIDVRQIDDSQYQIGYGITHISIVSGDHQHTTQIVAETLGVDDYAFEVLSRQKADIVKRLQDEGRTVCFVGDGINDALAMKAANVSVSLRGATTVATDTAQVILLDGSLSRLCDLFDLSQDLHKNLVRSLAILGSFAVFNVAGAFVLGFRMVASTVITNSSFFVALANAMSPEAKRMLSDRASKVPAGAGGKAIE